LEEKKIKIKKEGAKNMDNSSFAIGLGVGTVLGLALGVSITIMMKKPEIQTADDSGVIYNYDDKNRLQSVLPMNKRLTLRGV